MAVPAPGSVGDHHPRRDALPDGTPIPCSEVVWAASRVQVQHRERRR